MIIQPVATKIHYDALLALIPNTGQYLKNGEILNCVETGGYKINQTLMLQKYENY